MSTATSKLRIQDLSCQYQGKTILDGLDLALAENEILALLGPSGCGKTTLLRAIAGLLPIHQGDIELEGQSLSTPDNLVPTEHRGVGVIFQDYALFPHLTVAENIAFGLKGRTKAEVQARVAEMIALVKLDDLGDRYIHQLSGGQQQRVAIARALAYQPRLLLLDEPFSNIDSQVRGELMAEIRQILRSQGVSAIFVTHSKEEAFAFADRLAILHEGRVAQSGPAEQLYYQPSSRFVADFLGGGNYLDATVATAHEVHTPLGAIQSASPLGYPPQHQGTLLLRPQQLALEPDNEGSGVVVARTFAGTYCDYQVEVGPVALAVRSGHIGLELGQRVAVAAMPHALVLF
ncbi:ABC transporter ATP-binding protein [Ferrimonas marina]|uniref:Iron(III) transport system ATP-binding protein n=1 Tax=Ferrimonas marina TaxID=299255 RepID=A0A1M5ZPK6_9GAMM|nr:ABC transporter ATP-binding protein [Ferrimonas marina]SHI26088.1 iron(III) transport system ATP-binding protein [Ferrimonas marina]